MFWETFNDYTALPNVGTDVGPNLTLGDTANVGVQAYVCVAANLFPSAVWAPVGVAGIQTRSYGDTTLIFASQNPNSAFPTSSGAMIQNSAASGGSVDLTNFFDTIYFRCLIAIRVVDVGGAVLFDFEQRFGSLADIATWINANVPNDGSFFTASVKMSVLDQIDGAIPMPPKVYGKNRFWAGLTSRAPKGFYWTPRTASAYYGANNTGPAPVFAAALEDVWNLIHGVGTIVPSAGWGNKEFGCFWINSNRLRRYDMPAFNPGSFFVTAANPNTRFTQVPGPATSPPLTPNWVFSGIMGYVAINPTATGWTTFSQTGAFNQLAKHILEDWSVLACYGLAGSDGDLAVQVRPAGIDQMFFDWYDSSTHQLEVVGRTRIDFHPRIRVLTPLFFDALRRTAGPVSISQIRDSFGATSRQETLGIVGRHSYTTGEARFQLRRLQDNHVSPLTTARVAPVIRRRARPWVLRVTDGVSV
jgi:hypothetical protein